MRELREQALLAHSTRLMFSAGSESESPGQQLQREQFEERERARQILTAQRARFGLDEHGNPIEKGSDE